MGASKKAEELIAQTPDICVALDERNHLDNIVAGFLSELARCFRRFRPHRAAQREPWRCGRWVIRSSIALCCCASGCRQPEDERGRRHPTRVSAHQRHSRKRDRCQPARISIDTKKKELIGDYKAVGREFQPTGVPVQVQGHDFPDPKVPRAFPYGVYDIANDEGWS